MTPGHLKKGKLARTEYSYMIKPLIIFIAALLICSCNVGRHRLANKIVYKVFDSLDNYLCERIGTNQNTAIIISECRFGCGHLPHSHNGSQFFQLWVIDYKLNLEKKLGGRTLEHTIKHTNRYMRVCGKLYPVYLEVIDRYFLDPYDSVHIANYRKYARPILNFSGHLIYVDMEQAVFFAFP